MKLATRSNSGAGVLARHSPPSVSLGESNACKRDACKKIAAGTAAPLGRRERGSAVIVVLALLAIITVYVVANSRTLFHLKSELKLIEQQQLKKFTPAKHCPAR